MPDNDDDHRVHVVVLLPVWGCQHDRETSLPPYIFLLMIIMFMPWPYYLCGGGNITRNVITPMHISVDDHHVHAVALQHVWGDNIT